MNFYDKILKLSQENPIQEVGPAISPLQPAEPISASREEIGLYIATHLPAFVLEGKQIPIFPHKDEQSINDFAQIAREFGPVALRADEVQPEQIEAFIAAATGQQIQQVDPVVPDVPEQQEQQRIEEMDQQTTEPFLDLFFRNQSQAMLEIYNKSDQAAASAMYNLSDEHRYYFFIKTDNLPPEAQQVLDREFENRVAEQEREKRKYRTKEPKREVQLEPLTHADAISNVLFQDPDVTAYLDKLLEQEILKGGQQENLTELEKFIVDDMKYEALREQTGDPRQTQFAVDEEGKEYIPGESGKDFEALFDPNDDSQKQAFIEDVRQSTLPITEGVASLANATADWVRQLLVERQFTDENGETVPAKIGDKMLDWLDWADQLEIVASSSHDYLNNLLQPENVSAFEGKLRSAKNLVVERRGIDKKTQKMRFKEVRPGKEKEGDIIKGQWELPRLSKLIDIKTFTGLMDDFLKVKQSILANERDYIQAGGLDWENAWRQMPLDNMQIIRENKKRQQAGEPLQPLKPNPAQPDSLKAFFIRQARQAGVSEWSVASTFWKEHLRQQRDHDIKNGEVANQQREQEGKKPRQLPKAYKGLETRLETPAKTKEYLAWRLASFLPGILSIVKANPDRYNLKVRDALFGLTGLARNPHLQKVGFTDEKGDLKWKERGQDKKVPDITSIGGQRNSIHGGKTNIELYYAVLESPLPDEFIRHLAQAYSDYDTKDITQQKEENKNLERNRDMRRRRRLERRLVSHNIKTRLARMVYTHTLARVKKLSSLRRNIVKFAVQHDSILLINTMINKMLTDAESKIADILAK